jgi:Type III restriction enzyme, res subunit
VTGRTRTREWLRGFLDLGARADKDGIPAGDVERQEETVLRAFEMLDERPGIVLADEVGMGKTYEAPGIAAAIRKRRRRSRIVVVTPGPDLNAKWFSEFSRFRELYDFGPRVVAARKLSEFVELVRDYPIVVAPVTMFQSGKGSEAQVYLLSLLPLEGAPRAHGERHPGALQRRRSKARERSPRAGSRRLRPRPGDASPRPSVPR